MMRPRHLLFPTLLFSISSCLNQHRHPCAIKDFRQSLQPHLVEIVSRGIVTYDDSALTHMATDEELVQLSRSEHPVLRASAFREMFDRKSFNHFKVVMTNLDDT